MTEPKLPPNWETNSLGDDTDYVDIWIGDEARVARCRYSEVEEVAWRIFGMTKEKWEAMKRAIDFVRDYRDAEAEGVEEMHADDFRGRANSILDAIGKSDDQPK